VLQRARRAGKFVEVSLELVDELVEAKALENG
jgi:hypothetical protein